MSRQPVGRHRLQSVFEAHSEAARMSLSALQRTPFTTLLTLTVIAIALLIPALFWIVSSNFTRVIDSLSDTTQITIYLNQGVDVAVAMSLSERLQIEEDIQSIQYISPQQALDEFARATGLQSELNSLPENPLPGALILTPGELSTADLTALARDLRELPEADQVQIDTQWLTRLEELVDLLDRIALFLGVLVVVSLAIVFANTIKLGVAARQNEIRIIRLVGGTDAFIARPMLYHGLAIGFAGGCLAFALLGLTAVLLHSPLNSLAAMIGLEGGFAGPGLSHATALIVGGTALGWSVSLLSSWYYLTRQSA